MPVEIPPTFVARVARILRLLLRAGRVPLRKDFSLSLPRIVVIFLRTKRPLSFEGRHAQKHIRLLHSWWSRRHSFQRKKRPNDDDVLATTTRERRARETSLVILRPLVRVAIQKRRRLPLSARSTPADATIRAGPRRWSRRAASASPRQTPQF